MTADAESATDQPPPMTPALGAELERMQDAFVREWLFYRGDATHAREAEALRARGLLPEDVNLRRKKLARLTAGTPAWTFTTPGADLNVAAYLGRRWHLDHAPE